MNLNSRQLALWTISGLLIVLVGCERRQFYRNQADAEVNTIIQQSSSDPRWALGGVNVGMDPRSRYFDPYDPDRPPMPQDDPASHRFMHCVDGMRGYPYWEVDGVRQEMENPGWRERIGEYAPITEEGSVLLDRDSVLRMAYVNSTDYQDQLETLYLSALDVSTERFRFDTQFFGGTDSRFNHAGDLTALGERSTFRQDTDAQINRQFATAGTLLVSFANSFVWQFSGANSNSAFSLLGLSFVQPLLRNGGRLVALEQLTIVERALLSNLRAFERYRQGFYTDVIIGNSGVGDLQRRGGFFGGTGLSGFTGTGAGGIGGVGFGTFGFGGDFGGGVDGGGAGTGLAGGGAGNVGGFIGLLQSLQELRNAQDSFNLQIRTLAVLEAYNEAGQIDLVQVDQFRQSIETQRAQLLQADIGLKDSIDRYLTGTLSLPPDLPVELDDSFIQPFQLVADEFTRLQNRFNEIQDSLSIFADPDPNDPSTQLTNEKLEAILDELQMGRSAVEEYLATIGGELEELQTIAPERKQLMTADEQADFDAEIERLASDLVSLLEKAADTTPELDMLRDTLNPDEPEASLDQVVAWIRDFQFVMQEIVLVQARIRVEKVTLNIIQLDSPTGLQIALTNRYDVMNNRASIVDTWRLIAFNANRLQSDVTVRLDGDLGTTGNNSMKFNGATGNMSAQLQFDAPFTRLLERNNYRQALIDYQRSRRQYIQYVDTINSTVRSTLRQLEQLRLNLEIQRRAVVIAIRRVDGTQQELEEPLPVPVPGEPSPQVGATTAQNLLSALEDLRNTQNNFMSVWLNYYATRMALMRDLGIMQLDENGVWIDEPINFDDYVGVPADWEMPPCIPQEWIEEAFPEGAPEELEILPPQNGQFDEQAIQTSFESNGQERSVLVTQAPQSATRRRNPGFPNASMGSPNWNVSAEPQPATETRPEPQSTSEEIHGGAFAIFGGFSPDKIWKRGDRSPAEGGESTQRTANASRRRFGRLR